MYKVYYTDPATDFPHAITTEVLNDALNEVESLRKANMTFVTLVTDYINMAGMPGASVAEAYRAPPMPPK